MVNVRHLALLALLAGCQKGAALIVVAVSSPTQLPPIARLEVKSLDPAHTWLIGDGVSLPTSFGLEMPRGFHGHLTLVVTALDAESHPLANGSGTAEVSEGTRADIAIVLQPAAPLGGDMAMDALDIAAPPDLVIPPDMTITCANEGGPCTSGVGACEAKGTIVCAAGQPACSAMPGAPDTSGTWHLAAAANGSWDWNCDGAIEYEFPSGSATPPPPSNASGQAQECAAITTSQACAAKHWHFDPTAMHPLSCGTFATSTTCTWDSGKCSWGGSHNETQGCQ